MDVFKFEDFRGVLTEGNANLHAIAIIANDLLRDRMKVGYAPYEDADVDGLVITSDKQPVDTHKIYYIAKPLEEETTAVGCDDHDAIRRLLPSSRFCPDCGEKYTNPAEFDRGPGC